MKRLPSKFHNIVLSFFLTVIMTAIVSAISTIRILGFHDFFHTWIGSWFLSWIIAFPTVLFVMPLAKKLASYCVELNK